MRMIERRPPGRKFMPCWRFRCSAAHISACGMMSPALIGTFLSLEHKGIVPTVLPARQSTGGLGLATDWARAAGGAATGEVWLVRPSPPTRWEVGLTSPEVAAGGLRDQAVRNWRGGCGDTLGRARRDPCHVLRRVAH